MKDNQEQYYGFMREALMQEPEAAFELAPDTLRRYCNGNVGRTLKWLLRYPRLMKCLAEFAEEEELRRKGGEG